MKRILLFFTVLMLIGFLASAQTHLVKGHVTGPDGTPLPGITVQLKGTNTATATNANGEYELNVPANSTLIFTGVGFEEQNVDVSNRPTVDVTLTSSSKRLNEVVVTALGIRRNRNTLPYSAQQVSGDELSKTVTLNPVSSLSGKVAGLQITQANTMGGSTNVILRGIKSLTQSNQALFVVDGVPYNNDNQSRGGYDLGNAASDLNPDDIESVSVLKGPAASALYGSRGSNGVILITTKKGSRGKGINVTATVGFTTGSPDKSTLPVYQTQYGQGYGSAGASSAFPDQSGFFYYRPASFSNGNRINIVQTNNDAGTGPAYDPTLMVYNWDAFTPGDPNFGKATPWVAAPNHNPTDYFVTPITTTESVYLNGTNDKGYYKMGFTHDNNKDFMPNSYLAKNLLNFGATYKILQNLSIGGELDYSDNAATNRYLYPYTGGTSPMTDFRQWWPTNVNIEQQKADYFNTNTNATWNWPTSAYLNNAPGSLSRPSYHDNLYWYAYKNYENDSRTRYFGNVHINYEITPFLSVMGRVSKDNYNQMVETRNDVGSQNTPFYSRYNGAFDETNYDLLFNLDKNITNSLNIKAVLGGNVRQVAAQSIAASTSGGLVVPGFFALSNSVKTPSAPTESKSMKEVDGVFAGATLSYKELVTLDGTIRRDQSSTLPKSNNAYYYPSVSLNFQFAKLLPSATWLSHGKIWGNYAQVGGDAPVFSIYNTYTAGTPFNSQTVFSTPSTNNNANLVPESNKSIEFGIESSFLNDRFGFTLDYYQAKQINQIIPTSVSQATGFSTFFVNGGTVQNSGVELSVNIVPVRTRDFTWNMTINWSNNKQKVISLYNNQPSYVVASYQNAIRLTAIPGKPYQLQGTDYVYDSTNGQRVIDATGHYEIADNNFSNLGTPNPDWVGGINNSFKYKNFGLSFLIDARHGGSVYSLDMDYGSSSGLYPRTAGINDLGNPVRSPLTNDSKSGGIILKGVTEDGKPNTKRIDESDINNGDFSFSSAYGEADREFVYDASYVKLRELAITYSFPASVFGKAKVIKGIDISLNGRNLWIIHKNLPYADPEQGQASGNASMGFQNAAYPTIRSIGAILKVKF
jgi:TonB-linked SusC/RagA family outer membrane protein